MSTTYTLLVEYGELLPRHKGLDMLSWIMALLVHRKLVGWRFNGPFSTYRIYHAMVG